MENNKESIKKNLKKSNQESKSLTRQYIKTALLLLLKETPFEKITVTAIINRAGVSRAGFYRNYASKEEVLEDFFNGIYQQMFFNLSQDSYTNNPKPLYIDIFTDAQSNQETVELLMHTLISTNHHISRKEHIIQFYHPKTPEEYYSAIASSQARRAILLEWIKNGMKESPEEMADILIKIFHS